MGAIPSDAVVTKNELIKLLSESEQTAVLFAAWTGGLQPSNDAASVAPYYLKWVELAKLAIFYLNDTIDQKISHDIAERLISLMTVPLRGMLEAIRVHAKSKSIQLPDNNDMPSEVFAFKKWAIDYIGQALKLIKEAK